MTFQITWWKGQDCYKI